MLTGSERENEVRDWLRQTGAELRERIRAGLASARQAPRCIGYAKVALLAPAAAVVKKSIFTNEARMPFDISNFHFWNSSKAGMLMKTSDLFL